MHFALHTVIDISDASGAQLTLINREDAAGFLTRALASDIGGYDQQRPWPYPGYDGTEAGTMRGMPHRADRTSKFYCVVVAPAQCVLCSFRGSTPEDARRAAAAAVRRICRPLPPAPTLEGGRA